MNAPAPLSSFDADTALVRTGPGTFEGSVAPRWRVGRGPNGGYLAAILLRALIETTDDPARPPRSLTAHFAAVPGEGPVEVRATVERAGRALSTLSARMTQGGRLVALALAAFSGPWSGPEYADTGMPAVALPEDLPKLSPGTIVPDFIRNYDMRWAIGSPPEAAERSGTVGGWLRLAEPRPLDALSVAAFTDAWAPVIFSRVSEPVLAPTVDLTVHFRASMPPPAADPEAHVLGVFSSKLSSEGFWEEDGELYGRDGALIAQSRQLALALPPRH